MGVMKDLLQEVDVKKIAEPQATGTLSASSVDLDNAMDGAYLLVMASNETGSSVDMNVSLQDSADDSTWSDYKTVSIGSLANGGTTIQLVELDSYDQYIQADSVTNGATNYYLSLAVIAPLQDTTR